MEALVFHKNEKKLEYLRVPIPQVTDPDHILVRVAYSGVCGTDIHILKGEYRCSDKPVILGHEFSGTVEKVGTDVKHVKKGDRVAVDPNRGCHCCSSCHNGEPHFCQVQTCNLGTLRNGGWSTYALVNAESVTKLPDTVTLQQGALTEPISCVSHGWDMLLPIRVGAKILIQGAGIIGTLWSAILHHQGHRNVTVSEPFSKRLETLNKLETGFTLVSPDQLKNNFEADSENYLFDVIIDCSGYCPAIEDAIHMLKPGGKLCIFGVAPPHGKINVSPYELYQKEAKIFSVKINPFSFVKAVDLLDAMGQRYLSYDKLGVKVYELKDYEFALAELKEGRISKAIFRL